MLSRSLYQPADCGSWLHGEVAALDSRPAKELDCCGSHVKRVLTKRKDTVTVNEAQGEVPSGRKDTTSTADADRRRQGCDVSCGDARVYA